MMIKKTIRLGSSDSIVSNNKDNVMSIGLKGTFKHTPFESASAIVDAYEIYRNEMSECKSFRLTLTVKPYCSNVLYNACTEIVKKEGSDICECVFDNFPKTINNNNVYGKLYSVSRVDMISNTEYSKPEVGYEYMPGLDIFDNHILRNKGFRVVSRPKNTNVHDDNFNTIKDLMRYENGAEVTYTPRDTSYNPLNPPSPSKKHMYDFDNVFSFEESFDNNLSEDDGWFGFINKSNVDSKIGGTSLGINRVINNREACEFIDMYPDRTLFSFNPKYNQFRNREEYNWDILLTYPTSNFDEHPIVRNIIGFNSSDNKPVYGNVNALLIMSAEVYYGGSGERKIMLRTYSRHGLLQNDVIRFYCSKANIFNVLKGNLDNIHDYDYETDNTNNWYEESVKVSEIGDYDKKNNDYYFSVSDMNLVNFLINGNNNDDSTDYGCSDDGSYDVYDMDNGSINEILSQDTTERCRLRIMRVAKVKGNVLSKYYFRVFEKVPVEKYGKEIANPSKETYSLPFSNTIYNDGITQSVYTDDINTSSLTDNLGRPVTELYFTILKSNRGYLKWYEEGEYGNENVEYSHCFGKLTSGLEFLCIDDDAQNFVSNNKGLLSDVHIIHNRRIITGTTLESKPLEYYTGFDKIHTNLPDGRNEEGVTSYNTKFLGDLVEFTPVDFNETILEIVNYRFNTAQREYERNRGKFKFTTHELRGNDFDSQFKVDTRTGDNESILCTEGYYYQAHYPIKVGMFGEVNQSSHKAVMCSTAEPTQSDGSIYIKVRTSMRHNLYGGNRLYICDDNERRQYRSNVYNVLDDFTVLITPITDQGINWIDTCDRLNNKTLIIRKVNEECPDYAVNIGVNSYIWRPLLRNDSPENEVIQSYPYSNNNFYIDTKINFFLKRQDPHIITGLYNQTPKTYLALPGNIKQPSSNEYIDEMEVSC